MQKYCNIQIISTMPKSLTRILYTDQAYEPYCDTLKGYVVLLLCWSQCSIRRGAQFLETSLSYGASPTVWAGFGVICPCISMFVLFVGRYCKQKSPSTGGVNEVLPPPCATSNFYCTLKQRNIIYQAHGNIENITCTYIWQTEHGLCHLEYNNNLCIPCPSCVRAFQKWLEIVFITYYVSPPFA